MENTILLYQFVLFLTLSTPLNHAAGEVNCGRKPAEHYTAYKRIVGGTETKTGEWPWMTALFYRPGTNETPYFKCGATLLSDSWIATAAHCTLTAPIAQFFSVRLGEHDLDTRDGFEQDIQIKRFIVNPSFGIGAKKVKTEKGHKISMYAEHDIALMELQTPARLDKRTSPVCVDSGRKSFVENKLCYITGWGNKKLQTPTEPRLLHTVVPLVSQEKCNHVKSYGGMVTDNMVCAGFEMGGKDTCEGDSGGPLMCEDEGKWYLHGISSFGHDACAIAYKYGVYTKVAQYKAWIKNQTGINC